MSMLSPESAYNGLNYRYKDDYIASIDEEAMRNRLTTKCRCRIPRPAHLEDSLLAQRVVVHRERSERVGAAGLTGLARSHRSEDGSCLLDTHGTVGHSHIGN